MDRILKAAWTKPAVFLLLLAPLARLAWGGFHDQLGANPIEAITRGTGVWTLRILLLTLAISPVRRLLGWPNLIRFRRMIGLFAFFYALLHLTTYLWLDKFFDVEEMWQDVVKRRFITAGLAAFLLMVPLAVTSTAGWIRRLGGKRWQALHRLVYISAVAAVVHYLWLVKVDIRPPALYAAMLLLLLGYRAKQWLAGRRGSAV
jgi:sulfoxide reductase heme-binding subunit YedZ